MKGKKLTTKERIAKLEEDSKERRKIFKELCEHLSQGLSLDCFAPLSKTSIYTYLKTYPDEFTSDEMEHALRQGRDWWERIGKAQTNGSCLGNSRTWFYNMANRYGWRDRVELEAEHKGGINVNVISYASKKPSTRDHEQE